MKEPSRTAKTIAYGLGIVLLAFACGAFWMIHDLRALKIDFSSRQTGWQPVATSFKKALADVFVIKQKPEQVSRQPGLLTAYEHDPDAFQQDAKLFDAWTASTKLGVAVLKNTPPGNWERSSADANYIASQNRVDPWNHTFCLLRRGDHVLVVSGGPQAPSSPACRDIRIAESDLAKLPHGKLLESPAGHLMLVIDEDHAGK
jgi:hypothetical protein